MSAVAMLDMAFALTGEFVPADYAYRLREAVARVLPWFDEDPASGLHPLRGVSLTPQGLALGRRAQLWLRLPQDRLDAALALEGARLEIGGLATVGRGSPRALMPYPVLYSRFVTTGAEDEAMFFGEVQGQAAANGLVCQLIVGRRRSGHDGERRISGFSLMLHGLSNEHSLAAQRGGLGGERKLGCGIFVPHRTIAPVGG